MSDSNRSLREIYSTANVDFDKTVKKVTQGFTTAVDSALLASSDQEREAQQKILEASDSNVREIAELTEECLEAIRSSILETMTENENFMNNLKDEMVLNFRGLQQRIADVTESLLRSHIISAKVQVAYLAEHCDQERDKLHGAAIKARNSLREQDQSVGTKFGEELVKYQSKLMIDLMREENVARDQVPEILAQNASKIGSKEAEFRMLHKQHLDILDSRIAQIGDSMTVLTEAEAGRVDQLADETESVLRATYDRMTVDLFQVSERSTRDFYADMQDLTERSQSDVGKLSANLFKELQSVLQELEEEETKANEAFLLREAQLKEELLTLIEDQRLIPRQAQTVITQILGELKEIETNFETRMTSSLVKQLNRIEEQRDAASEEVVGTYKGVNAKLVYLQKAAMKQLQESESQVVKAISNRLERAKQLIKAAAAEEVD